MPERFEIYIVYKRRYINTLPVLSFYSVHLASNCNCLFETEELLKVTGSYIYCKCGNMSETAQARTITFS